MPDLGEWGRLAAIARAAGRKRGVVSAHLLVFIFNLGRSQELHRFAFEKHLGARGQFLGDWRRVRAERYHGDGRM